MCENMITVDFGLLNMSGVYVELMVKLNMNKKAKWWFNAIDMRKGAGVATLYGRLTKQERISFQQQLRCNMQQQFDSGNSIPNAGIAS
jgi:hypothetical protein